MKDFVLKGDDLAAFCDCLTSNAVAHGSYEDQHFAQAVEESVERIRIVEGFAVFVVSRKCVGALRLLRKMATDKGCENQSLAMLKEAYGIRSFWAAYDDGEGVRAEPGALVEEGDALEPLPGFEKDRRNVTRVGRVLGDGSRRGARTVRRLTVYLSADLAQWVDIESAQTGDQKSQIVERAVAAYFARDEK
jgi:hypothetical protein